MGDNLTFDDLLGIHDLVFPPLYYATDEGIERGQMIHAKKTAHTPEFVLLHPAGLDELKRQLAGTNRRLVHLRHSGGQMLAPNGKE